MKKATRNWMGVCALLAIGAAFAGEGELKSLNAYQMTSYYQHEQEQRMQEDMASGFYLSINPGYAKVNGLGTKTKGLSLHAAAGYQFNPNIAVEGGYTTFTDGKASNAGVNTTNKFYGFDAAVKLILPATPKFHLFAKAGAMYLNAKQTVSGATSSSLKKTEINPELGLGMEYYLNYSLALDTQGIATVTGIKTEAVYAGLTYKFNS